MRERKVAFILPGFRRGPLEAPYGEIAQLFQTQGITPIPVPIKWSRTTLSQNLRQFSDLCEQTEAEEKIGWGFSFGAVIVLAARVELDSQILCSLPPYFREYLPDFRNSWRRKLGKRRMDDINHFILSSLAPLVQTPTILIAGTEEGVVLHSCERAYKEFSCPKWLYRLEGIGHDLSHPGYMEAIKKAINLHFGENM